MRDLSEKQFTVKIKSLKNVNEFDKYKELVTRLVHQNIIQIICIKNCYQNRCECIY